MSGQWLCTADEIEELVQELRDLCDFGATTSDVRRIASRLEEIAARLRD